MFRYTLSVHCGRTLVQSYIVSVNEVSFEKALNVMIISSSHCFHM
jgi:hypothetical protein